MSSGRSRRATTKKIDYSKEQEFSDDDIFEEVAEKEVPTQPNPIKRRGRPRKNSQPAAADVEDTAEDGYQPSKPVYTEKGYDPALPPIRELHTFLPEYELDGSPRIELIVGRRPVDDKNADSSEGEDNAEEDSDSSADESDAGGRGKRRSRKKSSPKKKKSPKKNKDQQRHRNDHVEYEYLVKFKGRSYLHLDWKTGADLESMGKSAKVLYRRYLKKLAAGLDDELENPDFDPSFAEPQKVVDECEQEVTLELSDHELIEWEKEREKALREEEEEEAANEVAVEGMEIDETDDNAPQEKPVAESSEEKKEEPKEKEENDLLANLFVGEVDFSTMSIDALRTALNEDGPYYPTFKGCDNPYRDGYITEPPKKPRASYLFFQCATRAYFAKKHPNASLSELMSILGETWRNMSEQEQAIFVQLASEEAQQYEKERAMMAKAQKPNEMWQPLRRCRMVLDRLSSDGFASIFLEPVDLEVFTDYEEMIDQPMDLGTVRTKLKEKKYQAPENFARDMRKIWNNCKIYNQHGSAIWFVADYMSKQFERLYHAWVLEFRERYLRWVVPNARPWEHTCRKCDGKCGTPDDKMVLCDHCDAMYALACLDPPMEKAPEGIWHCPDCHPKIHSVKGVRMYSAVAEQAARKRAELGDVPKKKVKQTMYLVKWAGLGYEFCTWETKEDINDDSVIENYQRLNNMIVDEPPLEEEKLEHFMEKLDHLTIKNAGGSSCIPELRALLYAQSHAYHFSKFGELPPEKLCLECGPKSTAACVAHVDEAEVLEEQKIAHSKEVVECVADMVQRISRGVSDPKRNKHMLLPPLLTGEYDAVIPITSKGLMMNVGEINGSVAFLGYRAFPDGTKGPAEVQGLIRNVGDKIIAVDGVSTINLSFKEVILLLRKSGKNKFAFMRFLENRYTVCSSDLTSVGMTGRYAVEELHRKFSTDRKRLIVQRRQQVLEDDKKLEEESDGSVGPVESSSDEESDEGSEGSFEPDSDDEEIARARKLPTSPATLPSTAPSASASTPVPAIADQAPDVTMNGNAGDASQVHASKTSESSPEPLMSTPSEAPKVDATAAAITSSPVKTPIKKPPSVVVRNETTRSLAYRLLDMDVGYSSDEGGDDDCAYYVDGVDSTFTTSSAASAFLPVDEPDGPAAAAKGRQTKSPSKKQRGSKPEAEAVRNGENQATTVPVKGNEFSSLGDRAKLAAAVCMTQRKPDPEDFDNFPLPSRKAMDAKAKADADEKAKEDAAKAEAALEETALESPSKSTKRSTVKVEQVSVSTEEVIRIWANAETAAATLQLNINEIRQMLKGEYDEDLGDEIGGYRWRYAAAGAEVTASTESSTRGSKKGKEAFLEFRDKLYDPADPHIYKNGNKLRDYQVDGVNWLASTWYKRHSCILADEMGLGKTVQIVSYIEHLFRVEKIKRPYLVVVPLSTVEHWRREFQGWSDMVCCVYHDRQRQWRDVMREYEWYFEDRPHTADYLKFDVLVTTYDTLIGDFDIIGQIPWRVAVVDEAHRLRNIKGKLLECMKEISARGTLQYGFQSRVLMTGTPLQNNTQELWTLLNFIEPFKFPSLEDFEANFGNIANRAQVEALQQKISPYMLRRVKEDVAKDIPEKEETVIDVELTSIQKQYYRAIFEHNHSFLSMGASRTNAPKLMNIQMELRKCCNHPFLLEGVEQRESEKQFDEFVSNGDFEGKTAEERQLMLNVNGYIKTSGKMVLLDKLLPKLREEGHKVLIFSQMVRMLDLISEYCDFRGFRHERLDGRIRGAERQKSIDRFETEEDSFLFLLSTRAGGVGINLTAADICIIFDSDWNPQNDTQAQARCHRIGQTKDVRVYRLVTSRSFEQEMFDRASKKLGLEQAVLGTFNQDNDDDKPTTKEMEQLLKKGAYALLEDENDEIGNQFAADDIESILAKRTRTRVVEGAKTASWLNKQGMVVSKSKFSGDSKAAGVDVDDPLFWQKVMPDFVTPAIMLTKLDELSEMVTQQGKKSRAAKGKKKEAESKTGPGPEEGTKDEQTTEGNEKEDAPPVGMEAEDQVNEKGRGPENEEEGKLEKQEDGEDKEDASPVDMDIEDKVEEEGKEDRASDAESEEAEENFQLSRTNQRKVAKFMSDLKSMMEGIFEEADDDSLPQSEKSTCQKLLLTISIKERLFNEDQRKLARNMLKRLEGDRRRRCRTSIDQPLHASQPDTPNGPGEVREELLILSKHQRRKRRKRDEPEEKRRKRSSDKKAPYVGEDGYLHDSDSPADWSDVGEDLYQSKKRNGISDKEAKRRRAWAIGDDAATAAGRQWPVFPRHFVGKVLTTLLDSVIKYDEEKGGIFSVPVPREEVPEYYELIKQPMDYGTMREKLERGEYRSAQAMQKDFILVMQNCLQFNERDSEIVMEARQQALMRPGMLRDAAMKHKLFIAEDGSVLEVYTEGEGDKAGKGDGKKKKRKKKSKEEDPGEDEGDEEKADRKVVKGRRKKGSKKEELAGDSDEGDDGAALKKPRIRISLGKSDKSSKKRKRKPKDSPDDPDASDGGNAADDEKTPAPKKKRSKPEKKTGGHSEGKAKGAKTEAAASSKKKKPKKKSTPSAGSPDSEAHKPAAIGDSSTTKKKKKTKSGSSSDPGSIYLNISLFSEEKEALDGTFEASRANFTKRGPWRLPLSLAERFDEVGLETLEMMWRNDRFDVFAEAVTEEQAPGYSDVVKQPMDFGTMRRKIKHGEYGNGPGAIEGLYNDFLLVFENCALYNDDGGEVLTEAARVFGLLPETYASACSLVSKRKQKAPRKST